MIVVLQSHLLAGLDTVVVAPLIARAQMTADHAVFVEVVLDDAAYVLNLAQIASLPSRRLGRRVASLVEQEYEIRRGLDRLFTGF